MKKLLLITIFSFVNLLFFFDARAQAPASAGKKTSKSVFSFSMYPGIYMNGVSQNFSQTISSSRTEEMFKSMYMYGVRVGYPLNNQWETELDFFYSPTRSGGFRLYSYFTSLNAVYNIRMGSSSVIPYLIGGPGLLYNNLDQINEENLLGVGLGAGVKLFVTDKFALRPELRIINTFDSYNAAFAGSLMLTYYLDFSKRSSTKDTDGDGIPDKKDPCPLEPETVNGYKDEDGCPDVPPIVDTDGDGIQDAQDKCPTEKESMNGFQDEDGCPDVPPQLPAAFAEPAPTPDPNLDTDGDGIPDTKDQCPFEKETYNGYLDNDGCQDTVPEELKPFTGKVEGIQFAIGSSIIEKISYKVLDSAVAIFKKNPALQIKIEGHTDNIGGKTSNLRLSKERAESVRQYLASRGIDLNRIEIEGYGFSKPITSNSTSTGRSQNRRIEFKLQKKDKS